MHDHEWMDDSEMLGRQMAIHTIVCLGFGLVAGLFIGWIIWA